MRLRQAQGRSPQLQPGDTFWESEIVEAVRGNVMLERRMNEMRDVHGARVSEAAVDRVKRILALLEQSGPYQPFLELVRAVENESIFDIREAAERLLLDGGEINRAVLAALAAAAQLQ